MSNGDQVASYYTLDNERESRFRHVWDDELHDVFADVAKYYDRANNVASLGLYNWLRKSFMSIIEVQPDQQVLDVCAGTNAIGIALLKREPALQVTAVDRSDAMQEEGQKLAIKQGLNIESVIHDVHKLPFPDNHFDIVTLQYASRHLRIYDVVQEVRRVLKPGGYFYHSDMLRPANKVVEKLYYTYLRGVLTFTAKMFGSKSASLNCRDYFIHALQMFYSAEEFSVMLRNTGFDDVSSKTVLGGTVGFHRARKM